MRRMRMGLMAVPMAVWVATASGAALFENDFGMAPVNEVPADFLVLDGQFAVRQEGSEKFLELPGAPLETFGVLFGPTQKDGLSVAARIHGTGKGRRFPVFAVSLGGANGHKLQVSPAKKAVELLKGDQVLTASPWEWQADRWTWLRLQVQKVGEGRWRVEGKAWTEGAPEPEAWLVTTEVKEEPVGGKAGVWGKPFSGTPIRFDDLKVTAAVAADK